MSEELRFAPEGSEIGQRVDVVLSQRAGVTRTLAQRALKTGVVTVGGVACRPSHRLEEGDVVAGTIPDASIPPPVGEDIPVAIRYEDDRVLVISKPAGLVTHPARGHEGGTLVNALLGLGGKLSGAGSTRPGIVHRLDKETSGLLLVAKDDDAHGFLVDAMQSRTIERRYLALVRGELPAASGTIDAPVGRHPTRWRLNAVVPSGKAAVTHYELVATTGEASLVRVRLETGRTHQIRVHLSHLGHPVLGDRVYGGVSELSRRLGLERPFLHAAHLAFPHPNGTGTISVDDPLPSDLVVALGEAGLAAP